MHFQQHSNMNRQRSSMEEHYLWGHIYQKNGLEKASIIIVEKTE